MFESKLKLIFWNENWGGLPRYLAFKKSMGAKNSLFFVTKIAFFYYARCCRYRKNKIERIMIFSLLYHDPSSLDGSSVGI